MASANDTFWAQLRHVVEPIWLHFLALCVTAGSIWVFQTTLSLTLGSEAKLFDIIPIKGLAYVGYLVIFARFVWEGVKEFKGRRESSQSGEDAHYKKMLKVIQPILFNMIGLCVSLVAIWAFDHYFILYLGKKTRFLISRLRISHMAAI